MMEAPVTESTATEVSAEAASHKGEFFLIDAGLLSNGGVPGIEIANEDKLIDPGMNVISRPDGTPGQYPERPHWFMCPRRAQCHAIWKSSLASGLCRSR